MREILFCTYNPILIKNLYGIVRDEGYEVDVVDHPSLAVQRVLCRNYDAVIIDANPFGLSVDDAVQIIKTIAPDITIIVAGYSEYDADAVSIRVPSDLAELRKLIHNVNTLTNNTPS